MKRNSERGRTYHCPVCGAELTVLVSRHGAFDPVCCNVQMVAIVRRPLFYTCPLCGSQVMAFQRKGTRFAARCCNVDMRLLGA